MTWCLKQEGFRGLQLDRDFGGRWNNIFEPSGFAQLASLVMVCMSLCAKFWGVFPCMRNSVCTYTYLYRIYLYSQYPLFLCDSVSLWDGSSGVQFCLYYNSFLVLWLSLLLCAQVSLICAAAKAAVSFGCPKVMNSTHGSNRGISCQYELCSSVICVLHWTWCFW